jgi:hypothetical protein
VPHALAVLLDLVEAALRTGRDAEAAAHVAAMHEANLAGLSSRLALVVGAAGAMVSPARDFAMRSSLSPRSGPRAPSDSRASQDIEVCSV